MEWTSIFKKKPKKSRNILVLLETGETVVTNFNGEFFTENGLLVDEITHWLYIPALPSKEERTQSYSYEDLNLELPAIKFQ